MTKWRYTLLGWLMWRLWKRRLRSKLGLLPQHPMRRWAMIGVGGLVIAAIFKRARPVADSRRRSPPA
jgi:hypothetical protein